MPGSAAVVGFDAIGAAAYTAPALASVRGPGRSGRRRGPPPPGPVEGGPGKPVGLPDEPVVREPA
ncbi:hypothetical protein ACIGW0_24695 [Streptomyces bikiniensis]|uniref:Uncharacterized protein n=1 Tax=Streptomyces bikiniensis TaxID=1896 RepID=A0ABW8CY62_STRBI